MITPSRFQSHHNSPAITSSLRNALLLIAFILLAGASSTARAATVNVPAGGDFQAAINAAQPGDVIVLQAGASYTGTFWLPVKSGATYITVRTSAPDSSLPAADARITPASSSLMPKILAPGYGQPALATSAGALHFRFIGIEF